MVTRILLTTALLVSTTLVGIAQESPQAEKMKAFLAPWLDPALVPATGLDSNVGELVQATLPQIQATVPDKLSAEPKTNRRILVVTADTAGALHAPGAAGLLVLLRELQKQHPSIQLTEVFAIEDVPVDRLSEFDAIILNNVSAAPPQNHDFYNKVLPEYVSAGGGLFCTHGTAALYRKEEGAPYNTLLGGFTTAPAVHPKKGTASAYPVKLPDPDHPLAAAYRMAPEPFSGTGQWLNGPKRGLFAVSFNSPVELADELYTWNSKSNSDGASQVIASIDKEKLADYPKGPVYEPETTDFGYALSWYKPVGKGRVFYTQFGHNYCVHAVPAVSRSLIDGLQFVCGDLSEIPKN